MTDYISTQFSLLFRHSSITPLNNLWSLLSALCLDEPTLERVHNLKFMICVTSSFYVVIVVTRMSSEVEGGGYNFNYWVIDNYSSA